MIKAVVTLLQQLLSARTDVDHCTPSGRAHHHHPRGSGCGDNQFDRFTIPSG